MVLRDGQEFGFTVNVCTQIGDRGIILPAEFQDVGRTLDIGAVEGLRFLPAVGNESAGSQVYDMIDAGKRKRGFSDITVPYVKGAYIVLFQ